MHTVTGDEVHDIVDDDWLRTTPEAPSFAGVDVLDKMSPSQARARGTPQLAPPVVQAIANVWANAWRSAIGIIPKAPFPLSRRKKDEPPP